MSTLQAIGDKDETKVSKVCEGTVRRKLFQEVYGRRVAQKKFRISEVNDRSV